MAVHALADPRAALQEHAARERELVQHMAALYQDPLEWVRFAYPWGSDRLRDDGPDVWQQGFLREWGEEIRARDFDGYNPVMPVQASVVSGHGVGKSALSAWIPQFIMSTRPHAKGIITANTAPQLETKTWGEMGKWYHLLINRHWFGLTTGRGQLRLYHKQHPQTWRVDGMAWVEHKAEAFAGLHAATSTPFYLFDEASGIPRAIFDVAQGGLTDGEPMLFLFGNGTKTSGFFYESHHRSRDLYKPRLQVDSRTAKRTNKELLNRWIEENGIDSDFVKVRVLGQFPNQSSQQLIPTDAVNAARKRDLSANIYDALIMTVDVSRFGMDKSVIRWRQGRDATVHKKLKFGKMDTMTLAGRVAEEAKRTLPDAIVIDGGGVGGGVVDRVRQLQIPNVYEFNFGGRPSPDPGKWHDYGAYVWDKAREWLVNGGKIEDDEDLASELTTREYFYDMKNAKQLESKDDLVARGEHSPDDADAFCMSFMYEWGPRDPAMTARAFSGRGYLDNASGGEDYDPFNRKG